jgi:Rap1a immunity proteins
MKKCANITITVIMICLFNVSSANSGNTNLVNAIHESQSLIIDNSNFSTKDFFNAFTSTNLTERRYAEMYLLGVIDATEGINWCSYKIAKTGTVEEIIYSSLKKLSGSKDNQRASSTIREILATRLSCKSK